ncbi:hypothetical protein [Salegentibacter sp. F14]
MLKLPRTDIEIQLQKVRNRRIAEKNILAQVQEIFAQNQQILEKLNHGSGEHDNTFEFDLLERERIYHLSDIEKICIDYRLRFLDSSFFKAEIPTEAISEIKKLEKKHQTSLRGFKIIAPSKLLKLDNADDPLLFAPMGNDYFYLIHKWGNDLHPLRKILMWPFKYIENFALVLLALSFLLALMVPDGLFSPKQTTTQFFIIFFFVFKWIAGLSIFYGVKFGKNFNSAIWQSRFYNA